MSILPESYPLPITPIGVEITQEGLLFHFQRSHGGSIAMTSDNFLTFAQLNSHESLRLLFDNDETWLRLKFPVKKFVRARPGDTVYLVIGFDAAAAADYLATRALRAEYFPPDDNADTAPLAGDQP